MSLVVRVAGQVLTLAPKTKISMEWFSPVFDAEAVRGTYTYSFDVLLDPPTRRVFGYPDVIESTAELRRVFDECEVEDAGQLLGQHGELRIQRIRPRRLSVIVTFGLSRLVAALERPLSSFELGGLRQVPAVVDSVPGLMLHANATVREPEQYDYVFAPLLNYYQETESELPRPPLNVNLWLYTEEPFMGVPAGGSFAYQIPFGIFGSGAPSFGGAPLVKLSYLVRAVLAELGLQAEVPGLLGELGQLVVLTGSEVSHEFQLSDVLPATTVRGLLAALKTGLGLLLLPGVHGQQQLVQVQQLLDSTDYEDWTHLAAGDYDELQVEPVQGLTLTYEPAQDDAQAEGYYAAPDQLPIGPAVATVAELPMPTVLDVLNIPSEELRLVESEQAYYRSTLKADVVAGTLSVTWARNGSIYQPVPLLGGGEERGQGFAATAVGSMSGLLLDPATEVALVPALSERPYLPGEPADKRSANFRLAFYRGLQPYRLGPAHPNPQLQPVYPLLTPFNRDAAGARLGNYSLQLDGADGTAARLVGQWLELLATATPVRMRVMLSPAQLANLKLGVKKRIAGNLYLVKQVSVSLPVEKGAVVTLVPLRRG